MPRFGNEQAPAGPGWGSVSTGMKARDHKPARRQVRGVVEELGDLVENLGLVETSTPAEAESAESAENPPAAAPPGSPPPLAAPPPPSAPTWRSGPEVVTGSAASGLQLPPLPPARPVPEAPAAEEPAEPEPLATVPMWESADPVDEPPAEPAAVPAVEPAGSSLWDHFSPELAAKPARPWSPAAAMVELEPLAPPGSRGPSVWAEPMRPFWRHRPHAFTVLTTVAAIVALAVFVFSRVDLGRTTGPSQPVTHPAFVLDTLRAVSATSAAQVRTAKTVTSYPASAQAIYLDITYRNVTADDVLQVVILLRPQQEGQAAVTVSDQTHGHLDPGGEVAITVPAPPGGFTPGSYEVRALHDGTLEQSITFTVQQ